ncbi:hypothetical protein TNCT_446491 [Trichonephila clavata]|uniref:Uncharacterized protein n=1 Tax=Trichonephila clavata TaxID=2740835 RepID=A0A8X6FJS9_TRICU|nr:hypothetical protein TNCT_446491 [Trichonephila clavata]
MGPKSKQRIARNKSISSDPRKIRMERFAYDVFVSIFIQLGATDFPECDQELNHYKNSTILKCVSAEVLCRQFYFREEFMETFTADYNIRSFSSMEDFTIFVNDTVNKSGAYGTSNPPEMVFSLFAVHVELFLFLQSRNISVNFAELPRSWYRIYTRDIFKFLKDDIYELIRGLAVLRRRELVEANVRYFLSEYFTPYGAKEDCSKVFRLVNQNFPQDIIDSDETINPQLIERITRKLLFENAMKNLPAASGRRTRPRISAGKAPASSSSSSSSGTIPRQREPDSLSYSQWELAKQSAEAHEEEESPREEESSSERSVSELKDLKLG